MRRRRRRGRPLGQQSRLIVIGAACAALIGAFILFMNMADNARPAPKQTTIELPNAFKD